MNTPAEATTDGSAAPPGDVQSVLRSAVEHLVQHGVVDTPRLDAELLLGHVTGLDRVGLRIRGEQVLTPEQAEALSVLLIRRAAGEPVAYLIGTAWFYGRAFEVDHRVLVPRPETELLVELALAHFVDHASSGVFVDACTGSGCVAVSIAAELGPRAVVRATDLSPEAIEVAAANACRHEVEVDLRVGDLLDPIELSERAAVIVANPPYVEGHAAEGLEPAVRDHEPHVALFLPEEGFETFFRRLAGQAAARLEPGGLFAVEHGAGQRSLATAALHAAGFVDIEGRDDLAGIDRVVLGYRAVERG